MPKKTKRINRQFPVELKNTVVQEYMAGAGSAEALAQKHGVSKTNVRAWVLNFKSIGSASRLDARRNGSAAISGKFPKNALGKTIWPVEFKNQMAREVIAGANVAQLAAKHGVAYNMLYTWTRHYKNTGSGQLKVGGARKYKPAEAVNAVVVAEPQHGNGKTDGRIQMYLRAREQKLLQIIGAQTVEIYALKEQR